MTSAAKRLGFIAAGGVAFALAATANAGGYRYGASDQAFYIPAIRTAMDASLFPRDGWMLAAQGRVIVWDGLVAGVTAVSNVPLPWVFLLLYLSGMVALYAGALMVARAAAMPSWGTVAFLAVLTLRHRIAKTGVNTLEGYLHPRMLAFALGVMAIAAFLRRKPGWAGAALVAAGAIHPTTGVWFGMLLGVAAFMAWPRRRAALGTLAAFGAVATIWAITAGPLASRVVVMDDLWLAAIAPKDYLFPHEWPLYAWVFNLLPVVIAVLALTYARRMTPEMRGLLFGALALTLFFLATLPLVAMRYALAVQMQIPRVFWLVELTVVIFIASRVTEVPAWLDRRGWGGGGHGRRPAHTFAPVVAILLITLSVARGASILFGEKDGRLLTIDLPASDWTDAMAWLRRQPADVHVLADPGHAFLYGSSVRVAAERDVFHEEVKDAALAMYDRDIAARVVDRRALTVDYTGKRAPELLQLAGAYALDYVVTEGRIDLPIVYENATFRIYAVSQKASGRRDR